MQCNCSLNNNYEVIGLCDIKEFNKKIDEFSDKSWVQINIPETLYLPNNSPNIEAVTKVNININITSSRPVNTPESELPSIEGLKLTGKILLVSGIICQNIIYIANNLKQSIHSVKFNVPFNTYIVIDKDTDVENDKFCVYPCIENVFIKPLDKRSFTKSINLFLFAHRIEPPLDINNEFIFYDFPRRNRKEVVRISFDGVTKKLIATSAGNIYNSPNPGYTLWFELKDSSLTTTKAIGTVQQNEDGTNFVISLNNAKFKVGDIIFINYQVSPNVVLTNFPFDGDNYDMNFVGNRSFEITKNEIIPTMLPNVIVLNSINDEPVLYIGFDTIFKFIFPNPPKAVVTNPAFQGQDYFTIIVKDSNSVEKYRASIQGNQDGRLISNNLINKAFDYSDIVQLNYLENQRVRITENPYPSSTTFSLSGNTTSFVITKTGLQKI